MFQVQVFAPPQDRGSAARWVVLSSWSDWASAAQHEVAGSPIDQHHLDSAKRVRSKLWSSRKSAICDRCTCPVMMPDGQSQNILSHPRSVRIAAGGANKRVQAAAGRSCTAKAVRTAIIKVCRGDSMTDKTNQQLIEKMVAEARSGRVSRRDFMHFAIAAGVATTTASGLWTTRAAAATPKKGGKFRTHEDRSRTRRCQQDRHCPCDPRSPQR